MDNAHVPTSVSRGRNEKEGERPTAIRAISPSLVPKCETCLRAFSSPDLHHDSITRTERDENLPLATAAVDHSRTRWRGADVSTREKSNVTSGAEGATTARARPTEEWPAIRKRPSLPRPLSASRSPTSFRLFPFRRPLPLLLSAHCRCHLCQKGAREEPECRLPRLAAPPADQITNKTNFLAAPRTDAPFVVAAAPSCRRGCEMGPICGLRLRGSRPSSLPRPLVILILCKEKGTQYGSVSAEGRRGAIRCSKVGLGVGYR